MTVVAISEIEGDTRDILAKYDEALGKVLADPPTEMVAHTCAIVERGVRIATVWENEDAARAFYASSNFQEGVKAAGLQTSGPKAYYPVHNFRLFR
jgi:hypothetical protein